MSTTQKVQSLVVTKTIEGAHPQHPNYPLLEGDFVRRAGDGTWLKFFPGLSVGGFVLSDEDVQSLQPVWMTEERVLYEVIGPVEPDEELPQLRGQKGGYDL